MTATPAFSSVESPTFIQGITSAAGSYLEPALRPVRRYVGDWLGGYIAKHLVEKASLNYQANSPAPGLWQRANEAVIGAGVQKALDKGVSSSFKNWTP